MADVATMTDEALHALARILLRLCSPRRTLSIVGQVGALLPPHNDRQDVMRAGARIAAVGRGTCLSRALAVAARAPQAEIVIGVAPRRGEPLRAHAWLELSGEPLDPADVAGREIARLRPTEV